MASTLSLSDWKVAPPTEDEQQKSEAPPLVEKADPMSDEFKSHQLCPWVHEFEPEAPQVQCHSAPDSGATNIGVVASMVPLGEPQTTPPRQWQPRAVPPASPPPTTLTGRCTLVHTPATPTAKVPDPLKPLRPVPQGFTTLVVRNIPARFNQERVLQELWPVDATFDFLYLPCHAASERWPKGHAVINFLTPELALAFQQKWHSQCLSRTRRTRRLVIVAAALQGVWANLEVFLRKDFVKLSKRDSLPALFHGTQRANN